MKELCNTIRQLFWEAGKKIENKSLIEQIDFVRQQLMLLENAEKREMLKIAFVGRSNVGKSTLINALLGFDIAPRRNGPYTAAIVEYRYHDKFSALLQYPHEPLIQSAGFDCCEKLKSFLINFSSVNECSTQAVAPYIIVRCPAEILKDKITIYDTPGFGATKGENENGLHDSIIIDFLSKNNFDRLFWVLRDNPREEDLELFEKFNSLDSRHCHVIVNNRGLSLDNQKKYLEKNTAVLSKFKQNVLFINALQAAELNQAAECAKLRSYFNDRVAVKNSEQELSDLLQRFIIHCREICNCSVRWNKTSIAKIRHLVKNRKNAELIQVIENIVNLDE